MGKKSGPTPPPAPDPTVVANAQADANIKTAQQQQKLNMINTYGPDGSVVYAADPNAPGGYSQTTSLSPGQQQLYDSGLAAQNSAIGIANQQIGRVGDALSHPLDTSGLPALSGGINLSNLTPGQGIQYGFDQGQAVQGQVGPQNLFGAYQAAANASYGQAASRLDPQWANAQHDLETQLSNQGLASDSSAYQRAMDDFQRQKTDAYNQAIYSSQGQGLNAENTLFGQSVQQGQFANQAAGQMYSQNQGAAAFNNSAQNQAFGQNLSADQMQLANAQFQNQARNQGLQEQAYIQNEPLNQFNSLMSSSQVGMPTGINYTPTQVNPTDVLGAYALNTQANQAAYQAQMQNQASNLGGLFGLGSSLLGAAGKAGSFGALFASDARLKKDVVRVGRIGDLPVYEFEYVWGGGRRLGVMAQEAMAVRPEIVVAHPSGYLMVDYGQL